MAYFRTLPRIEDLLALFKKQDRWLIAINADPDALASAMALKRIMVHRVQDVGIAHVNEISRPDNLEMIASLRIPTRRMNPNYTAQFDRFALVDSQPHHHEDFRKLRFSIVIDHHPRHDEHPVEADFVHIQPDYGSNSTLLTEYLYNLDIRPGKFLATALQYGIKTDTSSFERAFCEADLRAFQYLNKFADSLLLRKIYRSEFQLEWLRYFCQAYFKMRVMGDGLFAFLDHVESPDILACWRTCSCACRAARGRPSRASWTTRPWSSSAATACAATWANSPSAALPTWGPPEAASTPRGPRFPFPPPRTNPRWRPSSGSACTPSASAPQRPPRHRPDPGARRPRPEPVTRPGAPMSLKERLGLEQDPVFLVDGHAFLYRFFYANPGISRADGFPTNAVFMFVRMLFGLLRTESVRYAGFFFDGKGPTFRHELFTAYKAQRPPMPDDLRVQVDHVLRAIGLMGFTTITSQGVEADDCIAALAARLGARRPVVIVGADKDLRQCLTPHVVMWDPGPGRTAC